MIRVSETTEYIILENSSTEQRIAVHVSNIEMLNKHYSDMDHFLYAPDDLLVEGIPITFNTRGLILFDFDNKTKILVKKLKPTWIYISK